MNGGQTPICPPFFFSPAGILAHPSQFRGLESRYLTSAGKGRMLCNDVKRVVYFFLDGSLGDIKKKDFSNHLNLCRDCEARMKFHLLLRNFLHSRFGRLHVDAPDRLKMRLSRSIRAFRTEWSR